MSIPCIPGTTLPLRYLVIAYNFGFLKPRLLECVTRKEAVKWAWYLLDLGYDVIEIEDQNELEEV